MPASENLHNRRLTHRTKLRLFDHLIGTAEQRERDGNAERFSGFQIDYQFDRCGLLHRQIGLASPMQSPRRRGG